MFKGEQSRDNSRLLLFNSNYDRPDFIINARYTQCKVDVYSAQNWGKGLVILAIVPVFIPQMYKHYIVKILH